MAEKLLIGLPEIKQYRPVADLVPSRVDPYIREAQINDLKQFLGEPLYYDLITNTGSTANQELINGKTYSDPYTNKSIDFYGLIPVLVYYSLARIVANNQTNITSFGVTSKVVAQSAPTDAQTLKMMITDLRSNAVTYQKDAEKFLNTFPTTYPLWQFNTNTEGAKTGVRFFKL